MNAARSVLMLWIGAAALLACTLLACSTPRSRVERSWGEGLGHTLSAQTATNGEDGPLGLDAPTAERVAEKYYRGTVAPAQPAAAPPSLVIGSAASASASAPAQ